MKAVSSRERVGIAADVAAPLSMIVPMLRWASADYDAAIHWQRERAAAVAAGEAAETVVLLEHAPVYTTGRRGSREHLLVNEAVLAARGAALRASDRGGGITFHGPGQLVVYPILQLYSRGIGIVRYVRMLEAVAISAAAAFGVEAERRRGRPGCWVGEQKLGSVGVRLASGVSTHGLALNVSTDLSWFEAITPCGLAGVRMTSLERESGLRIGIDAAAEVLRRAFGSVFGLRLAPIIGDAPS